MIEQVKINISIIVVGIAVLICVFMSLDGMVNTTDFKISKVPKFVLPAEMSIISNGMPTGFPQVKTSVLLGEKIATTVPPPVAKKQKPRSRLRRLKVNAIMIEGKEKIAYINGSMMKVGGYIHGRTILKIEKNGVLVTGPNGKKLLTVKD